VQNTVSAGMETTVYYSKEEIEIMGNQNSHIYHKS